MDLTNRSGAYRTGNARCPGCGEALREEAVGLVGEEGYAPGEVLVDVCDACGGLWLDWFDGEIHALAAGAEALRLERGTLPPRASRPGDAAACPRCQRTLATELYRFRDAQDDELVTGVEILRCAECAGSFVSRSSAYLLLDRLREPPPPTVWQALVRWLARIVKSPPRQ